MTVIQMQSGYDEIPTSNDNDHFRLVSSHHLKNYLDTTCIKYIDKQEGTIYAYNDVIIPFFDTTKTFKIIVDGLGEIDGSVSGKIYTDIDPSFFSIGKYTDYEYGGIYVQNLKNQEFFYASYFFN